jgi:hypothetical protein
MLLLVAARGPNLLDLGPTFTARTAARRATPVAGGA